MNKKKSSSKEPFLPLFFGDFLGATAEWDGEERALYLLLLGFQWTLGSLPVEPRKLRKLVDYQEETFNRWWPTVSTKFAQRSGRLANQRLEVHRAKTLELSGKNAESGKKGAAARWGKDGERHVNLMANANDSDGDRQSIANGELIANATLIDSESHKNANGERYGAPDGNPSHPIPSHPDPSQTPNPDISNHSEPWLADSPTLAAPPNGSNGHGKSGREQKASPVKRKRMPPDQPTEHMRAWAGEQTPAVDFDREIAKLRDHQFRDGHTDWDAVIRNWLRKAEEIGPKKSNGNGQHITKFDRLAARSRESGLYDENGIPRDEHGNEIPF